MPKYILAIDQGTSSSKAIIFDEEGRQIACSAKETTQLFPRQGWVEQNPIELWTSVKEVICNVIQQIDSNKQSTVNNLKIDNNLQTTVYNQQTAAIHNHQLSNETNNLFQVSNTETDKIISQTTNTEINKNTSQASNNEATRDISQTSNNEAHKGRLIQAIGIANQRETTIVWDATTGRAICNAIVWQDRRTAQYCDELKNRGLEDIIKEKTGLIIDAYFSATKIKWILDKVPGAKEKAAQGRLRFGTVDTWLLWNLTKGKVFATDVTNACRTMLYNIHNLCWDEDLLSLFGIPQSMLPEVCDSNHYFGDAQICNQTIPITGIIGDQQSALFGQMCIEEGSVKNTYGTGCFLLMNCGKHPVISKNRLLTTIAWKIGNRIDYALEGSIFVAGAITQWLRDGLGIINSSSEIEQLAASVPDNGGVYFVPALTGLGAPYWSQDARGTIVGITRGTTAGHIARAALEGIAFQTMDVLEAMEKDAGLLISELKVDGGASENKLLMQFQADILGTQVIKASVSNITALGAAYMAGLGIGLWDSIDELKANWKSSSSYIRNISENRILESKAAWAAAIRKTLA